MGTTVRYTPGIDAAGDDVVTCSGGMRQAGDDMYSYLNNMCESGQLRGDGIEQALRASQQRWHAACAEFADQEERFGVACKDAYANMIATDLRYASYF